MNSTASQHSLNFDAPAAAHARDRGIKRAVTKANPEWFAEMLRCGRIVANRQAELTTDDIVAEYAKDPSRPTTHTMRAMAGIVLQLKREKLITPTDRFVNSVRIKQHRCPIRVHRSLAYRGAA